MKRPKLNTKKTDKLKKELGELTNRLGEAVKEKEVLENVINGLKDEINRITVLNQAGENSTWEKNLVSLKKTLGKNENDYKALKMEIGEILPSQIDEVKRELNKEEFTTIQAHNLELYCYLWYIRALSFKDGKDMRRDIMSIKEELGQHRFFDNKGNPKHELTRTVGNIDRARHLK